MFFPFLFTIKIFSLYNEMFLAIKVKKRNKNNLYKHHWSLTFFYGLITFSLFSSKTNDKQTKRDYDSKSDSELCAKLHWCFLYLTPNCCHFDRLIVNLDALVLLVLENSLYGDVRNWGTLFKLVLESYFVVRIWFLQNFPQWKHAVSLCTFDISEICWRTNTLAVNIHHFVRSDQIILKILSAKLTFCITCYFSKLNLNLVVLKNCVGDKTIITRFGEIRCSHLIRGELCS